MRIDVLYSPGCPHAQETFRRVAGVATRLVGDVSMRRVPIETPADADRERFPGSPTVRVDGRDIEGAADRPVARACRLYAGEGVPPEWMIEAAIVGALGPKHVLFLCVANSSRSQMAEGIARSLAPGGVRVSSAGSFEYHLNPYAIRVLEEIGIDTTGQYSKTVDAIDASDVDAVVTLCAEQVCPVFLGRVLRLHWALEDPTFVSGSESARLDAFRATRDELRKRLAVLFAAWTT